jgi:outer membrane protein assembly factor BamB
MTLDEVLFVGFNRHAAAIDKRTGEIVWRWKSPSGTGFVSLMLDDDRLYAAVNGYVFCLDATTGQEIWRNPMRGFGYGVTSLVSSRGSTNPGLLAEAGVQAHAAAAAAGSAAWAGNGGGNGGD